MGNLKPMLEAARRAVARGDTLCAAHYIDGALDELDDMPPLRIAGENSADDPYSVLLLNQAD